MDRRDTIKIRRNMLAAFFAVVILFLLGGILLEALSYHLPLFRGNIDYDEPDWFFGEKGGPLQPTELSDQHSLVPGTTYILTTELSYNGEGDPYPAVFVTSGNYEIRAFLEGKPVFQYTKEERGFAPVQAVGGAAFTIPLGQGCQGKRLTMELSTPMHFQVERRLPGIIMGDYATILQDLLISSLPSICISGAILFVVLVLVLLGNLDDGTQWTYLYFSAFSYCVVLYRGMQDLYFLYIWANPFMAFLCEFFSLVVCPIPLMLSYRNELRPLFKRTFNWTIVLLNVNLVVQIVLHFTGLVDVSQMLEFTHLVFLLCALVLICAAVSAKRQKLSLLPFKKLLPILIGVLVDLVIFYWRIHTIGAGSFFSIGNFIGLGLLTSLIMMVLDARREREKAYREKQRNQYLETIAYTDSLTGLYNRAAFTREMAEIQAGKHDGERLLIVAADLNGLKKVNDSLGHKAGDQLLRRAADLMAASFGTGGKVFRTGGDEFFAILYNIDGPAWLELKDSFYASLDAQNRGESLPLSLALGFAFMENDDLDACVQKADKQMYENKNTFRDRNRPQADD